MWSFPTDVHTGQVQGGSPVCLDQLLLAGFGDLLVVYWAHSVDHKASRQLVAPADRVVRAMMFAAYALLNHQGDGQFWWPLQLHVGTLARLTVHA